MVMIDQSIFFREVAARICSSLHIEVAMFYVLPYLAEYMPVDEMYFSIYDFNINVYKVVAKATPEGGMLLDRKVDLSPAAIDHIRTIDKNRPFIADDWKNDPVVNAIFDRSLYSSGPCLVIPLTIESHTVGVLFLINWEKKQYDAEHANLLFSVSKPFCIALQNALRYQELQKLKLKVDEENSYLKKEMESNYTVIGQHKGLKDVYEAIKRIAHLNNTILLLGETGTGKEVIAREIHRLSERHSNLMVSVNCGAIPETLLDSELFGHEKGAFTGAQSQKPGYFERADKSTIFLDEIGELTADAQVRLLRVIEERQIERVGGVKPIPINTRIICATHRNLTDMVENGQFRQDLYFRISVFPITIPPLRDRIEDIPLLVDYFLQKKAKELGIQTVPRCSPQDMELLMGYAWPGNVRELQNLVERALILTYDNTISFAPLLGDYRKPEERPRPAAADAAIDTVIDTMDMSMAKHIRKTLNRSGGQIEGKGGAAELLDIHPNTLRNRMKKLNIDANEYKSKN